MISQHQLGITNSFKDELEREIQHNSDVRQLLIIFACFSAFCTRFVHLFDL